MFRNIPNLLTLLLFGWLSVAVALPVHKDNADTKIVIGSRGAQLEVREEAQTDFTNPMAPREINGCGHGCAL